MNNILRISRIGAGLVIVGLVILWFLMELLVRLTRDKKPKKDVSEEEEGKEKKIDSIHQQRAAAAATAVSIALLKSSFLLSQKQVDQGLTAWQSTNRHQQLHNLPKAKLSKRNIK